MGALLFPGPICSPCVESSVWPESARQTALIIEHEHGISETPIQIELGTLVASQVCEQWPVVGTGEWERPRRSVPWLRGIEPPKPSRYLSPRGVQRKAVPFRGDLRYPGVVGVKLTHK